MIRFGLPGLIGASEAASFGSKSLDVLNEKTSKIAAITYKIFEDSKKRPLPIKFSKTQQQLKKDCSQDSEFFRGFWGETWAWLGPED